MLRIAYVVVKPILSFHVCTEAENFLDALGGGGGGGGGGAFPSKVVATFSHVVGSFNLFMATTGMSE